MKREYAGKAVRGMLRLLFDENANFAKVVVGRENTTGLAPSPTREAENLRPSRPSESYNWHTGQSSPFIPNHDAYVMGISQ